MTTENTQNNETNTMLQIMLTEHMTLQTARSATISDANGRVSLYINSISSVILALAFIGQVAETGQPFFIFALVLLPPVFFIGLATYERTMQIGLADIRYTRGVNRIRHFYTEIAPQTKRYFILPTRDDAEAFFQELGEKPQLLQIFLGTPGMVIGLNSMLIGVFIGSLAHVLFALTLLPCILIAGLGFMINLVLHLRYHNYLFEVSETHLKVLFPSEDAPTK